MKMKSLHYLLFALLTVFAFSCKKSDSNAGGDSYVRIKKNGTWITYPGLGELGPDLGDPSKTDLGISARSADSKEAFDISIQIDGSNFTTGTYFSDLYPLHYVLVSYVHTPNSATLDWFDMADAPGREASKYTINIPSITSTEIKGTFTGNYLYNDFGTGNDAVMC